MYVIIWEYKIDPLHKSEFLEYYKPDGEWVKLFRRDENFLSTELLMYDSDEHRWLTIDRWKSKQSYEDFTKDNKVKYQELDLICEKFTVKEKLIGKYFAIAE